MIRLTSEQAFELVNLLASSYKSLKIEEATIKIYIGMIMDLDYETCKAAVFNLIAENEYFPTVAAIRKASLKTLVSLPNGSEAWAEVKREIARVGYVGIPAFSNDLIKKAVQGMGGWRSLCLAPEDQWVRRDFIKAYEPLAERAFTDALHTPAARQLEARAQEKFLPKTQEKAAEKVFSIADYQHMLKERGIAVGGEEKS